MKRCSIFINLFAALMLFVFSGCSGSSSSTSPSGVVSMNVTDAATTDYSHVYVTVTGAAFHTTATAGFSDYSSATTSGWQVTRLPVPVTVDLATLTNGAVYAGTDGNPLFSGMMLPNGLYKQIRIFLASTEDQLTPSAAALGLTYNNEVLLNGDTTPYPLRIADPDEGIRLIPETPVTVSAGSSTTIVLDFNLNNDVVEVQPNGAKEFILKARLGFFDMSKVGAVIGTISFNNLSSSRFVIKAEQVKAGVAHRVVRRQTTIKPDGSFTLYPLPVFGSATTATYDILLRGRNAQTAIVTGVKVHKGTAPGTGANLGVIPMQAGGEFTAQFSSSVHPTGAWASFYQTISGDSIPFEVRYRHLDPYTGKFYTPIELSSGPIRVASYTPGQTLAFATDTNSQGTFSMILDAAGLYGEGAPLAGITGTSGQVNVALTPQVANLPQVQSPASADAITTYLNMSFFGIGKGHGMGGHSAPLSIYPNKGQIFVTHGGMIIDGLGTLGNDPVVGNAMSNGGGMGHPVSLENIPGNVQGAHYGLYVLGWGNGILAAGKGNIDLTNGSNSKMIKVY